ncbi:CBS domain-containing protein [Gloeocapsa sp. PCC 73106]|uniref:CBS domain-containing protein n=1 Tax=Gloeocapsa sp. PCC 73106 TaxID=102232 RepID=UPI0002ABEBB4|nr:CBS domain-containing protein [Gloeocapsa sp. PCC 73106]ELR98658.1 tRNA nucleotidyltransferase/poly(A) polymerase [Gloeocapsa sp. PCC 73106]
MDLILCHQTADFDALGAAVGLTLLYKGARIVLTGGAHPGVNNFLALYRDEFALIERRSVNPKLIRSLMIVDTQNRERLGKAREWLDGAQISLYDHHPHQEVSDIPATNVQIEAVGATTTLIVEKLQQEKLLPNVFEATVMALGIHVDTGSLTFAQTTPRDAHALAWLMTHGANVRIIAQYVDPSLSPQLQQLLSEAIGRLEKREVRGYQIASLLLESDNFVPGLSSLTERLGELVEADALFLAHYYRRHQENCLTIIGRSRIESTNLAQLFTLYGGGGHQSAASVNLRSCTPQETLNEILQAFSEQIPESVTARELMSSPVRTIRPETTIEQAQSILFRYGHSGLFVVNAQDELVGVISRRDLDLALHHGFSHAPVKGYMTRNVKTISVTTSLPEIEALMVTYDIGRLPVLAEGNLVGIVTRTDVLRQLHQSTRQEKDPETRALISCLLPSLRDRLTPSLWQLLRKTAAAAQKRGWNLYLVGGAVRDLLLATDDQALLLQDLDLVVDGCDRPTGAGVELATELKQIYPLASLSIHGEFQTAALTWHRDLEFGSLCLDIATARTEFYPYPAANPEVEASSIRQDLYRRDFTINSLAIRLTSPKMGELLDFFGGYWDLRSRQIRVLHPNSFIEDPTRIYRGVRFAVRLGFTIEEQTAGYIQYAIACGIYERHKSAPALTTRLRAELKYLLSAPYWKKALQLLASLSALSCLHPDLVLTQQLWWQVRYGDRWLKYLDPEQKYPYWLVRLEILIAALNPSVALAQSLQLPQESIDRLKQLPQLRELILSHLSLCQLPSQIYQLLHPYDCVSLLLVAVPCDRENRTKIWRYLTKWSYVKAPINGDDLKALGYKPGPQYKEILTRLLMATLDGEISTPTQAITLLSLFI